MSPNQPRKSRENERAFVDHIVDMLHDLGDVKARAMFGGFGIYCHQIMIALIAESVLYLKVDDMSRPLFEAEGCRPFEYTRQGRAKPIVMSYYEAPASALEQDSALSAWGQRACDAARREATKRERKKQ